MIFLIELVFRSYLWFWFCSHLERYLFNRIFCPLFTQNSIQIFYNTNKYLSTKYASDIFMIDACVVSPYTQFTVKWFTWFWFKRFYHWICTFVYWRHLKAEWSSNSPAQPLHSQMIDSMEELLLMCEQNLWCSFLWILNWFRHFVTIVSKQVSSWTLKNSRWSFLILFD